MKIEGSEQLHKIVVLNPKGGSGKTTLAFNLAGYLASTGRKVALVDMDCQGSSLRWLSHRPAELPFIYGVSAHAEGPSATPDHSIALPEDIGYAVIDAPASLEPHELNDYTRGAHAILVPVLPSDLDIHAATRLISNLLLRARVSRGNGRLGIVANRVKERTVAYRQLMIFLRRLTIAVVGVLRDSQNYTWAAGEGLCIHDMPSSRAHKDLSQWRSVTQWLEQRLATPLTPRDFLRPTVVKQPRKSFRPGRVALTSVAAGTALIAVLVGTWIGMRAPGTMRPSALPEIVPFVAAKPIEQPDIPPSADTASTPANGQPPNRLPPISAGQALKERWQLSGVARSGETSVVILRDRSSRETRRVTTDLDIGGWLVTDAGRDYAVLAQNGEEVRLELDEETGR